MKPCFGSRISPLAASAGCLVAMLLAAGPAAAVELEGFTEPYQTIKVASDESGTVEEVFVREGQPIKAGQPLVRLNSEIHEALLAIAQQNMHAEGRLDAALADLHMRQQRLAKLQPLRQDGHARQEEVDRALVEVAVAEANVRVAQEDLLTRKLEYEKIKTQIGRRTIRAPISGVITALHKKPGEFVAPNDPDVLTLVQIDTLLANFTLTGPQAEKLRLKEEIKVSLPGGQTTGVVEFISPVVDAESGTVLIKIRIENTAGRFRSGQRSKIRLAE